MYTFKDFKSTINIVETRIANQCSDNPMRDLAFLADQYGRRREWDKASAASRQLLKVAEGEPEYKFAVTPVDIELALDRKRLERQINGSFKPFIYWWCFYCCLGFGVMIFSSHPEWEASILPWSHKSRLARAEYNVNHGNFDKVLIDCNYVLAANPHSNRANLLKAQTLLNQGRLADALTVADKTKQSPRSLYLRQNIFFQMQDLNSLQKVSQNALKVGKQSLSFTAASGAAYASAVAGDYNGALSQSIDALDLASSRTDKSFAATTTARILLHLNRFHDAEKYASDAIAIDSDSAMASLYRAEARLGMGAYALALEDANACLFRYPHLGRAYAARAKAFAGLGETANAEYSQRMSEFYKSSPDQEI